MMNPVIKRAVLEDRPHLSTVIEQVPNFGSCLNSPEKKNENYLKYCPSKKLYKKKKNI